MPRFVRFTDAEVQGRAIYVNPDYVKAVFLDESGCTTIEIEGRCIFVRSSMEETIKDLSNIPRP